MGILWLIAFHSWSSARAAIMSSDLDYTYLPHQQTSMSFELAGINLHRNEQELQEFGLCQGEKQNFKPSCLLGKMASQQLRQPKKKTTTWCLAHVLASNSFKYTDLSYLTTWGVTVAHCIPSIAACSAGTFSVGLWYLLSFWLADTLSWQQLAEIVRTGKCIKIVHNVLSF